MDDIRYASADGRYVAYRVIGDGPIDLLYCDEITMVSIESIPDEPHWDHFEQRLGSFARLIRFDRCGIGLSDAPPPGTPLDVGLWSRDALAVLDDVGAGRTAVLGSCGAAIALGLWRAAPHRVSNLVFFNATAYYDPDLSDPWLANFRQWVDDTTRGQGGAVEMDDVAHLIPSLADDPQFRRWWQRAGQRGASPKAAAAQNDAIWSADLRSVLPTVSVPTLVLYRAGAAFSSGVSASVLAAGIPGARLVDLPGADFFPFAGDADAVADEVEEFLTGRRSVRAPERGLATILFSDIVDSTARASALGDADWRARLDVHDAMARREIERFRGRVVKTTGDGVLATFDAPARAIQCGRALCQGARRLGMELRVGIHTGEVELRGDDVGGIAVHIGARVAAAAAPGTVTVSSTVKELVTGSAFVFADRGRHVLKGVPDEWRLFEVTA